MSSSLFYAGISLLILAFILWFPGKPWVRTPGWRFLGIAALLAYGIPATFFIWTILAMPEEATRLRVALLGLGFRATPAQELNIKVGGDQAKHEVWVKKLQATDKSMIAGQLKSPSSTIILQGPEDNPVGILAAKSLEDGSYILPNAIELMNGDKISFQGNTWELRFESRLLGPPQIEFHNTHDQTKLLLPGRALPVERQTYPVDTLLGTARDGLTGFFYRKKDRLFLAILKSDIKIERPGNTAPLQKQKDWEIASGTRLHVLGLPRWNVSTSIAGGVRDWRSFLVKASQQSLLLKFDSPEIHTLAHSDLEEIELKTGDTQGAFRVSLALGDWDNITDRYIHLYNVSRQVGGESSSILELPDTWREGFKDWEKPLILTAPGGQQQITNGEPAWLGEKNMAAVQIDLLEPPVQLALLTLILVIAKMLAAISGRLSALHLLVASAIELFVIFRVLLGYRVWILPPFEDQAMKFALTAWAFLPWAFIVASLRNYKEQNIWGWLPAVSGLVFSAIWCYQINDGLFALAFVAMHIVVLFIPFLQPLDGRRSFGHTNAKKEPWYQKLLAKNEWMIKNPWLFLAILLGLGRIILVFFGAKEAIYLGMRIPLSIVHIPLGLFIEAGALVWLWHKLKDKNFSFPLTDLVLFSLVPVFIWLPAAFAGDYGLIFLNAPVFIIVSAWLILTKSMAPVRRRGKRRLYYTIIVGVLYVLPMVILFIPQPFLWWVPKIEMIPDHVQTRFLQYAYPEKLEELATRESESLVQMTRALEVYTSKTSGHGYAKSELNSSLEHAQLREYALAIFIAGDWGTWGVIGLMLVYMMIGLVGASLLPWRTWYPSQFRRSSASTDIISTLAGLAALTFAFSSLYMILVSYNLLPFTGRNVYLFGLESGADILESFVLLAIVAFGAATIRDKEATW